jgi:hypothetical protein
MSLLAWHYFYIHITLSLALFPKTIKRELKTQMIPEPVSPT